MIHFFLQHKSCAAVVLYWLYSVAVSSMPDPGPNPSTGYLWLFRFCHTTAGNLSTALEARFRISRFLHPC
jgi:hypothetical protein